MNMLKKSFNKKNIPAMIGIILCVAAFIYIPNKEHTSKYMMKQFVASYINLFSINCI